jgi:predicted Rossmann fold nucleotide-binding protein DprA/Smf involved in DNA uptake
MGIVYLNHGDFDYPERARTHLADQAPEKIVALGNLDILKEKKTAFFCSSKCPGELIIKTYDLAKKWRDDGVTVIGGFHSPIEQECLTILLRGKQPVIACPARSIETMRLKAEYKTPLDESRLLFLSPFSEKEKRVTVEAAIMRNRFVAALADDIFVAHATEGGKIEAFCCELAARGRLFTTLQSDANANLIALGARTVVP